jgi:phenylacetate-CoA ligase
MDDRGLKPRDFQNVSDLQHLPLLDGMMIRSRLNEFVSSKYQDEHSRMSMYSGGTQSYVRRVTYWDHRSIFRKLAHNERDRAVLNSIVGRGWGQRQLFIYPPNSQEPGADRKLQDFWKTNTVLRQSVADRQTITMDLPPEKIVDRMNEIKPQVVFTYGSYIDEFFRYLSDRKPNIDLPRVWAYGADMLPADRREAIEKEFGCIVYYTYQSVETGRLGFQCERRQGFHLNVDLCEVHVVDEEGKIVDPGQTGSVVVSNLHNRATVLLNYKLDDIGSLAPEACSCGRSLPVLERLEGRSSDIIRLPGNRTMSVLALEGICRDELKPTI